MKYNLSFEIEISRSVKPLFKNNLFFSKKKPSKILMSSENCPRILYQELGNFSFPSNI